MKIKTAAKLRFAALTAALGVIANISSCGFIVFNDPDAQTSAIPEPTDTVTETVKIETSTVKVTETSSVSDLREEALKRLGTLPDRDMSTANVIIATTDSASVCPSETEGEVLSARALAVRAVEEKYNTHIIADETDINSIIDSAKAAFAADMYYADLLAVPAKSVGALRASGVLANMYSLPYADYSKPYYNSAVNSEAVLGNELYAVLGSANFNPDYLTCVYFNRELISKYKLENPYELVYSGGWTWDKFNELSKAATSDTDGTYGQGSELANADYIDAAASSMKLEYVSNPYRGLPELVFMEDGVSDRAKGVVEKLYTLIYSGSIKPQSESAAGLFNAGALLFRTDRLSAMPLLADSAVSWGVLPMPKYDASQDGYISPLSGDAPLFCAMANTPSYENSGLILEALNSSAYNYTLDVYFNDRVNYCLRDNDSISMLELVTGGASVDFSHIFASGFANLANATYTAVYGAVTSTSSLDALYRRYQSAAAKELAASTVIY